MTTVAAPHSQAAPGSPRAAWVVGIGCWVLSLCSLVLFFGTLGRGAFGEDWLFVLTDAGMAAVYGTVASLLLARRRHVVIIFLLLAAVGGGLAAFGAAWRQAVVDGRIPTAPPIEALYSTAWVPGTLSLFLVVPWLVRRRLDRSAWLGAMPGMALTVGFLLASQLLPEAVFLPLMIMVGAIVAWGLVSAAAVERRRRTAAPGDREGLAWLVVGTAVMAISFLPLLLPYGLVPDWTVPALHLACQSVFPIAIVAVIARQRLWGLELSVSRAGVAGALTVVLVSVYLLVSVIISHILGNETVAAVVATAAVVAALQPSRLWLQRHVRRMVFGGAADPARAAAQLGSVLGRAASEQELLDSVTESLGRTLRLESVILRDADGQRRGGWGTPTSAPERRELPHRGRVIGALELTTPPGELLDGRSLAALDQLAGVVTAALALVETATALEATRIRLTAARLQERQVIRRELHDGLVPWLAGLRLGLQAVQNTMTSDPETAASTLTELQHELVRRIEDVRSASRSLLPPVLSELGLHPALVELVDRQRDAGMLVELRCPPTVLPVLAEVSEGLAAAAYGICSEAVTNAARHSGTDRCVLELAIDLAADELRISCSDAGVGIADDVQVGVGTRSMIERAADQDGSVTIFNGDRGGTVVLAVLPLAHDAEAWR